MRTSTKSEVADAAARDVETVWIRKLLWVAIRQGHFQNQAFALGNRDTGEFHCLIRFPRE